MASSSGSSFKELHEETTKNLVAITRTVNQLEAEDINFHRSLDPQIGKKIDEQNARLIELAKMLTRAAQRDTDEPVVLRTTEDIDDNWSAQVDVIDGLLERANRSLDEYSGILGRGLAMPHGVKRKQAPEELADEKGRSMKTGKLPKGDQHKPQNRFHVKPRNDHTEPWKPFLTSKPHALDPLDESLQLVEDEDGTKHWTHPYRNEIEQYSYPPSVHTMIDSSGYRPLDKDRPIWVKNERELDTMIEELKNATEIAVDLEHHDTHSYVGIACLLQISTRDRDWIVDTLVPWRHKLERLNQVFADPNILKILHGSHSDIIWLQRDFGIYVVGLFDTYHASVALEYPMHGLAYLLENFTDFTPNKKLRVADWRVRPLPQILSEYAQADTHFLLHIYDCMRNDLVSKSTPSDDPLGYILQKSKEEALQRYEHPFYDFEHGLGTFGWYKLLANANVYYHPDKFAVFRAVHKWRDEVARETDESPHVIMPNNRLIDVAYSIPTNESELKSCVGNTASFLLRARFASFFQTIIDAEANGSKGPSMDDVMAETKAIVQSKKKWLKEDVQMKLEDGTPEMSETNAVNKGKKKQVVQEDAQAQLVPEIPDYSGGHYPVPVSISEDQTQQFPFNASASAASKLQDVMTAQPRPSMAEYGEQYSPAGSSSIQTSQPYLPPTHVGPSSPLKVVQPATAKNHTAIDTAMSNPEPPSAPIIQTLPSDPTTSLRAKTSSFWGNVVAWNQPKKTFPAEPKFVLPYPAIWTGGTTETPITHQPVTENPKKRKADAMETEGVYNASAIPGLFAAEPMPATSSPTNGCGDATEENHDAEREAKREKKRWTKAEKKARKVQQRAAAAAMNGNGANEPFDYATAPSVMNAPRTADGNAPQGFNPYKKAMDAPRGLPKKQQEGAGKSGTWSG